MTRQFLDLIMMNSCSPVPPVPPVTPVHKYYIREQYKSLPSSTQFKRGML